MNGRGRRRNFIYKLRLKREEYAISMQTITLEPHSNLWVPFLHCISGSVK